MADDMNYYEILGVTRETAQKGITKAFRKKARECHPDKNPDNPEAAALFHKLSKALEVLSDPKAKAAFDAVLKAKEKARLRTHALDAKRKKFKLDLEEQENAAKGEVETDKNAAKRLQEEIERLREEGSRLLDEQQKLLKKEIQEEQLKTTGCAEEMTAKLKIRWKSRKTDENNGGYTQEILESILNKARFPFVEINNTKSTASAVPSGEEQAFTYLRQWLYGEVNFVVVSARKHGSAVVEYKYPYSARMALENEHGLLENPLKMSWLEGEQLSGSVQSERMVPDSLVEQDMSQNTNDLDVTCTSSMPSSTNSTSHNVSERDYESIILMRMRQAQERKRLAEQLQAKDDAAG